MLAQISKNRRGWPKVYQKAEFYKTKDCSKLPICAFWKTPRKTSIDASPDFKKIVGVDLDFMVTVKTTKQGIWQNSQHMHLENLRVYRKAEN